MSITLAFILFVLVSFILIVPVILDWSLVPEIDEDEFGQPEISIAALNASIGGHQILRPALNTNLKIVSSNRPKLAVVPQMPYRQTADARLR
jgi:hypothetical protein